MTDGNATREPAELPPEIRENVPAWDDQYFDRVSDRLMYSYDLERDYSVRGESFALYGELRMVGQKQFLHPALSYDDHVDEVYPDRMATLVRENVRRLASGDRLANLVV